MDTYPAPGASPGRFCVAEQLETDIRTNLFVKDGDPGDDSRQCQFLSTFGNCTLWAATHQGSVQRLTEDGLPLTPGALCPKQIDVRQEYLDQFLAGSEYEL